MQKSVYTTKTTEEILQLKFFSIDKDKNLPLFIYPLLEKTGIVKHAFTTRLGGYSKEHLSSLNLSFTRGDKKETVEENYKILAKALEVDYGSFVFSHQTHTTNVLRVGKEDAGNGLCFEQKYTDIDGLITNEPGITLTTFYADCVPLYFVDPVHKAIGLSHSGWRGTVSRMGKVTLEAMRREFGTQPKDVICAIGPSICQDCYEISEDVATEFQRQFLGKEEEILLDKKNGKYQLDLWKANEIVLLEAGIQKENLAVTNICTCCNEKLLFSHRATKGKRGNLAAVLALK